MLRILNLGAGVQSTALYLMSLRQAEPESVPLFDYAIFADTQDEPESVYRHLEWLRSLGGPPILTATAGRLGDDLMVGRSTRGRRFASIPGFTSAVEGQPGGMLRRQCTAEYKVNVVDRIIRREILGLKPHKHIPKGTHIVQYFGLSYDEARRVARVRNRFAGIKWAEAAFPLFDLEMSRADCVAYLKEAEIPHEVPRSACVFCPFKSNAEWRHLKATDPAGWARAVEVDEVLRKPGCVANRGLDQAIYLHRSCVPLARADLSKMPRSGGVTEGECEGMCGL